MSGSRCDGGGTGDSGGEHTDHRGLCQGKSSKSPLIGPFQRPPWVGKVSYTSEGFLAYSLTASLMFPGFQAFSLFLCCLRSPAPPLKSLIPRVCVHSHLSRV